MRKKKTGIPDLNGVFQCTVSVDKIPGRRRNSRKAALYIKTVSRKMCRTAFLIPDEVKTV